MKFIRKIVSESRRSVVVDQLENLREVVMTGDGRE